ncbi:MAG: inositol monophosphatase [Minisyncoccia bacterium]
MDFYQKYNALLALIVDSGNIARTYFDSNNKQHEQKNDGSVVTEIDTNIETMLLSFVREHFPGDEIRGEEHGTHAGTSGYVWHIDPIDGTDNFLRKIPFCGISVARLGSTDEGSFGIIYNPITRQMFTSLEGSAVGENEHVCTLTAESLGGRFAISIGRGKSESWMRPACYALLSALGMKYGKSGTYGSTALELAYVAANRIDAFLTYGLKSYDYAAGLYMVRAGCGAISVCNDGIWKLWEGNIKDLCSEHGRTIFVSHPDVHAEVLAFIGDPKKWAEKI